MSNVSVVVSMVLGAVIITILYYIGVCIIDKRLTLDMPKKKGYICIPVVTVTGIITFLGWGAVYIRQKLYADIDMMAFTFVLICALAVISIIDIEKHIIPNLILKIMLLLWTAIIGIAIIFNIGDAMIRLLQSITGAIAGGLVFMLCYLLSKKQLGAGDVKLVFIMGLYLTGQRIMGAVFYGVLLCCVYSVIQIIRNKLSFKDGVPLTPFLYMGTLIALLIL